MNMLAGFANHDEPAGFNYHYESEHFFMEKIWPALYERSTFFERLKHLTGWAGLYEVSPDECAILGRVEQGNAGAGGRVFEAHSFSGHGVMHSYSAGQSLAELMTLGRYESLDLAGLSASRFETGRLIREGLVI
jgi:sarcosine oxidase subunit beta